MFSPHSLSFIFVLFIFQCLHFFLFQTMWLWISFFFVAKEFISLSSFEVFKVFWGDVQGMDFTTDYVFNSCLLSSGVIVVWLCRYCLLNFSVFNRQMQQHTMRRGGKRSSCNWLRGQYSEEMKCITKSQRQKQQHFTSNHIVAVCLKLDQSCRILNIVYFCHCCCCCCCCGLS